MDFAKSIQYPLQDKQFAVKLLIGTLLTLIPIVNFITYGYMLRVARDAQNGERDALPEWDNMVDDLVQGFIAWAGSIIYYLPVIVASFLMIIPAVILDAAEADALIFMLVCCFTLFVLGYSVFITPLYALAAANYAKTRDFAGAFFGFGARLRELRAQPMNAVLFFVFVLLVQTLIGLLASLTIWLCGLGLVFVWLGNVMIAHFAGQYADAATRGPGSSSAYDPVPTNYV